VKIIIFYQYFSTPKGSWGTRIYEFSKHWVEKGHEVEVVTSVYAKSDLRPTHFQENMVVDGIKVRVINVKINNKHSIIRRIYSFLCYAVISCWYALTTKADIAIASSGPITVGLPGLTSKWFRGTKLVFEVRDLWPEGAIELGIIKGPILKKLSRAFERLCYTNANLIVGLSPGMRNYISNVHKHPNVISVTNSANLKLFGSPQEFPQVSIQLKRKKYAIYTGNIGAVNNSYWLLHTAEELLKRGREDIKILLIGEGQQREELCLLAKKRNIENFHHLGLMPKTDLVAFIQGALVSLVPLKNTPILDTSSPNKFFESLAAGVPVIQNTNGWMKIYLEENEVGYTVPPDRPDLLANLLIELDQNPDTLLEMSRRCKICADRDFDQYKLATKYLERLEELV
jgi:glycosyltransferase involved in cell wall biosynthesis